MLAFAGLVYVCVCVCVLPAPGGTVRTSVEGGAGDRLGTVGLRGTSELLKNSAELLQEGSCGRERSCSLSFSLLSKPHI